MLKNHKIKSCARIIDANINRTKEGLRVCEEITRFIFNSRKLTERLKETRHSIDPLAKRLAPLYTLIKERKSRQDIGKNILANEMRRGGFEDIFFANIQRVKESIRVLEEFSKLINKECAAGFKEIRYGVYEIEKQASKLMPSYK